MCARAAAHGREMTWPAVARQYVESFSRALANDTRRRRTSFQAQTLANRPAGWPEIDLRHVRALTDDTGILQHAVFSIPRYEDGYCLDDNARALLLMTLLEEAGTDDPVSARALASRYLAFVSHAFDRPSGRFRNFLSYGRQWLEPQGSEDSHGRALWALGAVVGRASDPGRHSLAGELFHAAMPAAISSPAPGRGRTCCSASRSICARFRVTARRSAARGSGDTPVRPLSADERTGLAVVRGLRHVLQRATVTSPHRLRNTHASDGDRRCRPAFTRLAGVAAVVSTRAISLRSAATDSSRRRCGGIRPAAR